MGKNLAIAGAFFMAAALGLSGCDAPKEMITLEKIDRTYVNKSGGAGAPFTGAVHVVGKTSQNERLTCLTTPMYDAPPEYVEKAQQQAMKGPKKFDKEFCWPL